MKHLKSILVVCILVGMHSILFAQDDWKIVSHPLGFSFQVPDRAQVEEGEGYLKCTGYLNEEVFASFSLDFN